MASRLGRIPTESVRRRIYRTQPLELLDIVPGQAFSALPDLGLVDPIAQGARVDPEISSGLGDRLSGLLDDSDRPITEFPVVLLSLL